PRSIASLFHAPAPGRAAVRRAGVTTRGGWYAASAGERAARRGAPCLLLPSPPYSGGGACARFVARPRRRALRRPRSLCPNNGLTIFSVTAPIVAICTSRRSVRYPLSPPIEKPHERQRATNSAELSPPGGAKVVTTGQAHESGASGSRPRRRSCWRTWAPSSA